MVRRYVVPLASNDGIRVQEVTPRCLDDEEEFREEDEAIFHVERQSKKLGR